MIKLSLETKFKTNTEDAYSNLVSAASKFKWYNIYKNKLIEEFNSAQCQSSLMDFYNSSFEANQAGIDSATSQLINIIVGTTSKVVPLKTNCKKKAKMKWFDKSCFQLKHELNRQCKHVSKNPLNPTVRKAYVDCRKSYKKLLKHKENLHFIDLKIKLRNLGTNNSKQFCEIIRKVQNDHNKSINPVDFETWDTYFKNLYKCESSTTEENYNSGVDMQNNDADAINLILNRIISSIEVQKAVKRLKAGKSAGEDKVINEILKILESSLLLPITKLVNPILDSEKYSSLWCRNLRITLYKGGGNDDPDNYRGISIGSCLAKLYSTILYHRIIEVNDNFKLINNKQIGFLKEYRTADHLLVLDIIINEVLHKHKQKLFVAFVDLKKVYDKINRQALIFKLKKRGFSGKYLMSRD